MPGCVVTCILIQHDLMVISFPFHVLNFQNSFKTYSDKTKIVFLVKGTFNRCGAKIVVQPASKNITRQDGNGLH